ncbi:unnamed protein product [Phytophthora fragariaefolia]|uniref:Unnamed protein product n=1 Tax=Phytophthora fragariaefolia TaxID=1490495 RepID=A0A9W7CQ28_9STRA|nr:unnamed protein product [Phytophthora fragariaefolia]
MQEGFSLSQAKLHLNVPRLMRRLMVKPSGSPEPMDLSSATSAGSRAQRLCTRLRADVTLRVSPRAIKKLRRPTGAGPPTGDTVERVDIGHAVSKTVAPSASRAHCKKQDDKLKFGLLKVNSKRERSLRALVDCGASSNFVRLQRLARLDFEEVELPQSLLEVRLATGVVVRTERRSSWANLSCLT